MSFQSFHQPDSKSSQVSKSDFRLAPHAAGIMAAGIVAQQTQQILSAPATSEEIENQARSARSNQNFASIPAHSNTPAPALIQPQLAIRQPNDRYEQEADRVAQQVVQRLEPAPLQAKAIGEDDEIQLKPLHQSQAETSAIAATPELTDSIQQARGGGQPLTGSIRKPMEQAFRTDFSWVKVHTNAQSDRLNQSIQARAFTTGQDIFFRQGEYNPGSKTGQMLLAHELTHVMQQGAAGTTRPPWIQTMKQPLPNPPINEKITFKDSGKFRDIGGNLNAVPLNNTGVAKERAGTVQAILPPTAYGTGSQPGVNPLGWDYVPQVAVQKPGKQQPKAHRGWVRFHLLNHNLGGSGYDVRNLVPTLNVYNSSQAWQTQFEETAKAYMNPSKGNHPIAFEVEVDYHQNVVSLPPAPGDNQLEKFPKQISAEFQYYDSTNKIWKSPANYGTVRLNIPAPSVTPGNAEYVLTDCSIKTLTDTFLIHPWLADRIIEKRDGIATAAQKHQMGTIQDLYEYLSSSIVFAMFTVLGKGNPQGTLDSFWQELEDGLNKTVGTSLRLYDGWLPTGAKAVKKREQPISLQQLRSAAQKPTDAASQAIVSKLTLTANELACFTDVDVNIKNAGTLYQSLIKHPKNANYTDFDKNVWLPIHSKIGKGNQIYFIDLEQSKIQTKTEYLDEANSQWKILKGKHRELLEKLQSKKAKELFEQQTTGILDATSRELGGGFGGYTKPLDRIEAALKPIMETFSRLKESDQIEQISNEKTRKLFEQEALVGGAKAHFDRLMEKPLAELYSGDRWSYPSLPKVEDIYAESKAKGEVESWLQTQIQTRISTVNPTAEQVQAINYFQQKANPLLQDVYQRASLTSQEKVQTYKDFYADKLKDSEAAGTFQVVWATINNYLNQRSQLLLQGTLQDVFVGTYIVKPTQITRLSSNIQQHAVLINQIPNLIAHYQTDIQNMETAFAQSWQQTQNKNPLQTGKTGNDPKRSKKF